MVTPAQCDIWLARPVRPMADETARRLLRQRESVHTCRQIYNTTLHCRSHEHHTRCLRYVNGTTRGAVRPCATLCDQSDLDCHIDYLDIYIRGHSRMCICGCIFSCIDDYTFELGIRVLLHALIHMLSIHSDGALLFSCIVCNYGLGWRAAGWGEVRTKCTHYMWQ